MFKFRITLIIIGSTVFPAHHDLLMALSLVPGEVVLSRPINDQLIGEFGQVAKARLIMQPRDNIFKLLEQQPSKLDLCHSQTLNSRCQKVDSENTSMS